MENIWVNTITNEIPNLKVKVYSPPGREIGSSCGEFTKHYYHEEIETKEQLEEFKKWELAHRIYENFREDYISWDDFFMGIAILSSKRSKDPSTQVGACIVSKDKKVLSVGYNGAPRGINDECFNWSSKGDRLFTKYPYVIHAEENAIICYKGNTDCLLSSTIYTTLFPCNECAKIIVQSGIKRVIFLSDKYNYGEDILATKTLFDKCGVEYKKHVSVSKEILICF